MTSMTTYSNRQYYVCTIWLMLIDALCTHTEDVPHRMYTQEVSEPRGYASSHQAIIKPTRAMTVCLRIAGQPMCSAINATNQIYAGNQSKIDCEIRTEHFLTMYSKWNSHKIKQSILYSCKSAAHNDIIVQCCAL